MTNHKHKFKRYARSGKSAIERCACGEENRRPFTKKEKAEIKQQDKDSNDLHRLSRLFYKTFIRNVKKEGKKNKSGKVSPWRWSGWDLITRIEKFAAKNPEVEIAHCDDSFFSNSIMVLIPSQNKNEYWNTEIIIIPQCSREEPLSLYLSPRRLGDFIETLTKFQKTAEKKNKNARSRFKS